MTYSNGVVIKAEDYDTELCSIAQAFAAGKITEEQLNKDNIWVIRSQESFGADAYSQILHRGIDFQKMGGWSFARSENVEVCRLDRLPTFTKEGFAIFKNDFIEYSKNPEMKFQCRYYDSGGDRYYNRRLYFDRVTNLYHCELKGDWKYAQYCTGYPKWGNGLTKIYFTNSQIEELYEALHEHRLEMSVSAKELLLLTAKKEGYYDAAKYYADPHADC